jgi:hypothetical protein
MMSAETSKVVTKRDGSTQSWNIRKTQKRLELLLDGLATKHIDITLIINKVVSYAQQGSSFH